MGRVMYGSQPCLRHIFRTSNTETSVLNTQLTNAHRSKPPSHELAYHVSERPRHVAIRLRPSSLSLCVLLPTVEKFSAGCLPSLATA